MTQDDKNQHTLKGPCHNCPCRKDEVWKDWEEMEGAQEGG